MSHSRKRSALEDISPPARAKRSNSTVAHSTRSKTSQAATRLMGLSNENNSGPNRTISKSSAKPGKIDPPKQKVNELCDVAMEVEKPQYSFDAFPYAAEIFRCQFENEMKFFARVGQGINWEARMVSPAMRTILINWLIEVAEEYKLRRETLFLAVNYVDRFIQLQPNILRNILQLVGITCLLIASKYEEIEVPRVDELIYITDNTYCAQDILDTEKLILNTLDYDLTVSTVATFLPSFSEVAGSSQEILCHSQFLADMTLTNYQLLASYPPSLLAGSIVCLSKHTFDEKGYYAPEFLSFARKSQSELKACAKELWLSYKKFFPSAGRPSVVIEKYKAIKYCRVGSKTPPATAP